MKQKRHKRVSQRRDERKRMTSDSEFRSNNPLHGVRYFNEQDRHWIEGIFWLVAFASAFTLCCLSVLNVWKNWQERPAIVTFDDRALSIGTIPSPAITICSTEKSSEESVNMDRFIDVLHSATQGDLTMFLNLTAEELNKLDTLQHICDRFKVVDFRMFGEIARTKTIYETIKEIAPNTMTFTMTTPPLEFEPIFTNEGLCFTFNSLNSREIYSDIVAPELKTVKNYPKAIHWNRETGYETNVDEIDLYPIRAFAAGADGHIVEYGSGTYVTDYHHCCTLRSQAFLVAVHMPDQFPHLPIDFVRLPFEQLGSIYVTPNVIETSYALASHAPEKRGCYFMAERKLRFFQSYSQRHCELECLANFTLNECDCVPYWMPRDDITDVCATVWCYRRAQKHFADRGSIINCNCLSDCVSITFDKEYSVDPLRNSYSFDPKEMAASTIQVMFKQPHYIAKNRNEITTFVSFLAQCGGLLALFMGFSMLSIIEMIYCLTLRLVCVIKRCNAVDAADSTWSRCNHCHQIHPQLQNQRFSS